MRSRLVEIGGFDATAYSLTNIVITAGRTNYIDPISPATASGGFATDFMRVPGREGIGVGSTVNIEIASSSRFLGRITNIDVGRYESTWTATSAGLGEYAASLAPQYTVRNVPYSGGNRPAYLHYVAADILYNAGLLDLAGLYAITDYTTGFPRTTTTTIGDVTIERNTTELYVGAIIPAGTVLDQLNTLAANIASSTIYETVGTANITIDFTRSWLSSLMGTLDSNYAGLDLLCNQSLELVTNSVTVTYAAGSTVTYTAPASITDYGPFSLEVDSQLATATAAQTLATRILGGRYKPRWLGVPIPIDLENMPAGTYNTWSNLRPGRGLLVDTDILLEFPGALMRSNLFTEGYTETITNNSHTADLYAFNYLYTNTGEAWNGMGTNTWATMPNEPSGPTGDPITWLDMQGINL